MASLQPQSKNNDWLNPKEIFQKSNSDVLENKTFKPMKEDVFEPWKGTVTEKTITDKNFDLDQPLAELAIKASGINPKLFNPDWFKPDLDVKPPIPQLKFRRIVDASGDGSLAEVFEDGALKVSINPSDYDHLIRLDVDRFGEINQQQMGVNVNVTAKDLETGEIIDLGTQSINPDNDSFLVNLKDKLDAIAHWSLRDQYAINVETSIGAGGNRQVLESFEETITLIKPLQWGDQHRGDETGNDLSYRDMGSAVGSARIYQGRGGTDFLNLEGIRSTDVAAFNGLAGIDAVSASEVGKQAFYGGTVFDALSLKNGDELYLQGIERLRFEDVTIDLTPNLDAASNDQWNTQVMDVSGAWRFNTGSDDVVLVSLDTGFKDNGDGAAAINAEIGHVNYQTETNNYNSEHGHQAMSVMAANHDGDGVAGIAPNAQLWGFNVKTASQNGIGFEAALEQVREQRTKDQRIVYQGGVQGDWPWTSDGASTQAEVEAEFQASSSWGFFAIAAGNGGPGGAFTEADYLTSVSGVAAASSDFDHIASVGALQSTGREEIDGLINASGTTLAAYSNRGDNLTLVAPTDVNSIVSNGNELSFGGTSGANPNLAGVAALVWSENASIDGGELREILTSSAMDLGAGGFDNTFGFGLVNAEGAIRRAHALEQNQLLASFWSNQDFLA